MSIGRFSEAGLLEWMRFVIFRASSRERSQHTSGTFLSRRCFTLCITMEVEPRIAKQYKCHHSLLQLQKLPGKGDGGWGKKCLCVIFWLTRRLRVHGKKCILGHPTARATSYCLLPDTFWLRASNNVFKVGSIKFENSLSPSSILKKVCTRSKSSQGT